MASYPLDKASRISRTVAVLKSARAELSRHSAEWPQTARAVVVKLIAQTETLVNFLHTPAGRDELKKEELDVVLKTLERLVAAGERLPGNNPLEGLLDEAARVVAKVKGGA